MPRLSFDQCRPLNSHGLAVRLTVSRSTADFSLSFTGTHGFGRLINNFTGRFSFIALIVILCYVGQLHSCMLCMYSYLFCNILGRSVFWECLLREKSHEQWLKEVERSISVEGRVGKHMYMVNVTKVKDLLGNRS